jgi:hypothetical protein
LMVFANSQDFHFCIHLETATGTIETVITNRQRREVRQLDSHYVHQSVTENRY